jgi:hypothetical protein
MATLPAASQRGSPVQAARATPASAITRPSSAPRSSSSTTGSSGFLEVRTNVIHELRPLSGRDATTAVRNENSSRTMATSRMPTAQDTFATSWGWRSFSTPSKRAKSPPTLKITSATTNDQK